MARKLIKTNRTFRLKYVENEEDLKPIRGGININPPPPDGRCDCCGRHMSELTPFGKAGDPLIGDFDGALLVKKGRTVGPSDEEAEQIIEEYFGNCETEFEYEEARRVLIQKYGEDKALDLELRASGAGLVGASWECRDCAVLDNYDYWEKRIAPYSQKASGHHITYETKHCELEP